MHIRREVVPFIAVVVVAGILIGILLNDFMSGSIAILSATAFLLFFFRDPNRIAPTNPHVILSGADGRVMSMVRLREDAYMHAECIRMSVFLSIFDVHVNRSPLSGHSKFLGYFPGKRHFAFREKSSEMNQHNKILIEGSQTRCLVTQIVGPIARRVVYWLDPDSPVPVKAGDRIGMMKFGSRLDIYLPAAEVEIVVRPGDRVRAGETIIARIKSGEFGRCE